MYRYPDFPSQVYVELTNACNARCTICATPDMERKRTVMPMELFSRIIDECGRKGAARILPFLHGESLLVPNIHHYFRYIRRAAPQAHVNLTTNGSRLDADLAEIILREDLLDSLIVSIDGPDQETFERIRLGLRYEEVRQNVLHFIERRRELGKARPTVSVAMVTVPENRDFREEFKRAWAQADDVRFSVFFNWAGKLPNQGRVPYKVNYCERLQHYITVLADGRVAMCCFDSEAQFPVGDTTCQSLYDVWHSDAMNEKRRRLYQRDFRNLSLCAGCDYINHPRWAAPLVRLRPFLQSRLPLLTQSAENLYKRWLMRG
jgi:sulfatase maturation enzyme AslB (radical SAM superfamily)